MELKVIFSNSEPTNKNTLWVSIVEGVPTLKVFTANGWSVIGNTEVATPMVLNNTNSLYEEYVENGGTKTREEFNNEIFDLIG